MKENINISEFDQVFRQQLENATAQPPPGVWEGITSGLSTATTASTAVVAVKTALWVKVGIGVIATATIASAIYLSVPAKDNTIPKTEMVSVNAPLANNEEVKAGSSVSSGETNEMISPPVSGPSVKNGMEKGSPVDKTVAPGPYVNDTQKEVLTQPNEFKSDVPVVQKQEINPVNDENTVQKEDQADTPIEHISESYIVKTDSSFIFIPDAFTPNGDGMNDGYLIDIKGEESVRIMIFSITMNRIFETTNKLAPWTGIMPNGELAPVGTYVVKVIYRFPGSSEKIKTVTLKLIR